MQKKTYARPWMVVALGVLVFLIGLLAVPAEQVPMHSDLTLLARHGCESGSAFAGEVGRESEFVAMLGLGEKAYSFRLVRKGPSVLLIPTEHCHGLHARNDAFPLVLGRAFLNDEGVREGYFYLTNQRGEFLSAVHFDEGRPLLFAYADLAVPVRQADFEAEKRTWQAHASQLTALHQAKQ